MELEVQWLSDGTISAGLYDGKVDDGATLLGSVSHNDSTYSSSGIGLTLSTYSTGVSANAKYDYIRKV